jgi:hypothetical protein
VIGERRTGERENSYGEEREYCKMQNLKCKVQSKDRGGDRAYWRRIFHFAFENLHFAF